jgi:death on curing protein
MAASYLTCLTMRHPFVDGNKRTALASALTFLYVNGYTIEESYDTELADMVLKFLTKEFSKEDIIAHFRANAI